MAQVVYGDMQETVYGNLVLIICLRLALYDGQGTNFYGVMVRDKGLSLFELTMKGLPPQKLDS